MGLPGLILSTIPIKFAVTNLTALLGTTRDGRKLQTVNGLRMMAMPASDRFQLLMSTPLLTGPLWIASVGLAADIWGQ